MQFDTHVVHRFQAEGFQVIYIPFLGSGDEDKDTKVLKNIVHEKEDELENGERYAIVGASSIRLFFFSSYMLHYPNQALQTCKI